MILVFYYFSIITVNARIGSTDKFSGGSDYNATSYVIHPLYNSSNFDFDVALVNIAQGMRLDGTNSSRIRLIRGGSSIPGGTTVDVTGWGAEVRNKSK